MNAMDACRHIDRRMDRTDGLTDRRIDGRLVGPSDRQTTGRAAIRPIIRWTDRRIDRWTRRWTDRQMNSTLGHRCLSARTSIPYPFVRPLMSPCVLGLYASVCALFRPCQSACPSVCPPARLFTHLPAHLSFLLPARPFLPLPVHASICSSIP